MFKTDGCKVSVLPVDIVRLADVDASGGLKVRIEINNAISLLGLHVSQNEKCTSLSTLTSKRIYLMIPLRLSIVMMSRWYKRDGRPQGKHSQRMLVSGCVEKASSEVWKRDCVVKDWCESWGWRQENYDNWGFYMKEGDISGRAPSHLSACVPKGRNANCIPQTWKHARLVPV